MNKIYWRMATCIEPIKKFVRKFLKTPIEGKKLPKVVPIIPKQIAPSKMWADMKKTMLSVCPQPTMLKIKAGVIKTIVKNKIGMKFFLYILKLRINKDAIL